MVKRKDQQTINDDLYSVLEGISSVKSLPTVCKEKGISAHRIYQKIKEDESFGQQYARACDERTFKLAESILDDIEEAKQHVIDPATARVSIDAKKWLLSKLEPKKYGDKSAVELTGAEGGPVAMSHTVDMDAIRELNEMLK